MIRLILIMQIFFIFICCLFAEIAIASDPVKDYIKYKVSISCYKNGIYDDTLIDEIFKLSDPIMASINSGKQYDIKAEDLLPGNRTLNKIKELSIKYNVQIEKISSAVYDSELLSKVSSCEK